jgi:NAD(P)-dependent dehydrogenase (short-subunit alcohol dehydrogenase family)
VTGASSGIGFSLADTLGSEGYALTIVSRRPERLALAEARLLASGYEVQAVAADVGSEERVRVAIETHRERYGRLDVLVNNAGFGLAGPIEDFPTKRMDLQLSINLRSVMLFYREALELLSAAGAEHGNALVINMSSVAGKAGTEWLSVYSAAKHGIVGFTQAMNRELHDRGIKSCALCPGFVDTELTDYLKDTLPADEMITTSDVAEMARALLRLSRWCVIPEIVFMRPGDPTLV